MLAEFRLESQIVRLKRWLSTGCSSRGPGLDFQHPRGGSQSSVTPVLVDPVDPPLADLVDPLVDLEALLASVGTACTWCRLYSSQNSLSLVIPPIFPAWILVNQCFLKLILLTNLHYPTAQEGPGQPVYPVRLCDKPSLKYE